MYYILTASPGFLLDNIWAFLTLVTVSIILGAVILVVTLFISKRFKNLNFFDKIKLSNEDKDDAKTRFACYNSLCHPEKISYIFMRVLAFSCKLKNLQDLILIEQKKYSEQKITYLKEKHLNMFVELIRSKGVIAEEIISKSDNFQNLANSVDRIYFIIQELINNFMIENHLEKFDLLPLDKWQIYKNDRIELVIQKIKLGFSVCLVPSHLSITEKELREKEDKEFNIIINDVIDDILERCKKINKDIRDEITIESNEINEFLKKLTGVEINIEELK